MTYEQKLELYNKAVSRVMENWDFEKDCPKTIAPMFAETDEPYSRYSHEEKATRIVNIQEAMEPYLKSTIHYIVSNEFFDGSRSCYYLERSVIEKYRYYNHHCNHQLLQPIHDVIAEVFRYQNRGGVQRPLMEIDYSEYFSHIYVDVDFLEAVDASYQFVCVQWYEFVCREMKTPEIIRLMGYSLMHYDDENDYYHERSRNESYLAARYYQDCHPEIKWRWLHAREE